MATRQGLAASRRPPAASTRGASRRRRDATVAALNALGTELISLIFDFLPSCPDPSKLIDSADLAIAKPPPLLCDVAAVCRPWRAAVTLLIGSLQWRRVHLQDLMAMLRHGVCDELLLQRLAVYPDEAKKIIWRKDFIVLVPQSDGSAERMGMSTFFHKPHNLPNRPNIKASHQLMTLDMQVTVNGHHGQIVANHMPSTPQSISGGFLLHPMMETGVYYDDFGDFEWHVFGMPELQDRVEYGALPVHVALWQRRSAAVVAALCRETQPRGFRQYYANSWWTAGAPVSAEDPAVLASQVPRKDDTVQVLIDADEEEDVSTEGQVGIVTNVTASGHFEVEFAVGYPLTHLRDLEASEVRLLRRGEACAGMRACGECRSCITNGPPIWRRRASSCIQTCFVALRRMAEALETPADVLTAMTAALGPSQEALDEVEARGWTVHAKEREVAAAVAKLLTQCQESEDSDAE